MPKSKKPPKTLKLELKPEEVNYLSALAQQVTGQPFEKGHILFGVQLVLNDFVKRCWELLHYPTQTTTITLKPYECWAVQVVLEAVEHDEPWLEWARQYLNGQIDDFLLNQELRYPLPQADIKPFLLKQ